MHVEGEARNADIVLTTCFTDTRHQQQEHGIVGVKGIDRGKVVHNFQNSGNGKEKDVTAPQEISGTEFSNSDSDPGSDSESDTMHVVSNSITGNISADTGTCSAIISSESTAIAKLDLVPVNPPIAKYSVPVSALASVIMSGINEHSDPAPVPDTEHQYMQNDGLHHPEDHAYTDSIPEPVAEVNPPWNQLLQKILDNKVGQKSRKKKDNIPFLPLRRSVKFEGKGTPSN